MADDPYKVLGVAREASASDIQKAYRSLAKKLHPDLNPGDKQAEERFKAVSAAYDILGDADKRARYDRGEIDASGAEPPPQQQYYRDFASRGGAENPYANAGGFADFGDAGDAGDIFAEIFRQAGAASRRGSDVRYQLEIDFLDAVNGVSRQVTLADGVTLDVKIPPGARDGQILRLRGKGGSGRGSDGQAGDAYIELKVKPHRFFTRDGDDIRLDLPISLSEAVLGGRIEAPTPTGPVTVTVPKGSNTGKVLRLKGKGVLRKNKTRGDEYLTLQVVLPAAPDAALEEFVKSWKPAGSESPRRALEVS